MPTCEPVPAKSCSWVMYVAAWGLSRDCTFLLEDGKRLSHNPLNVLLLCVGKTEYHVIRVCPEGGLHECVCVCGVCVCVFVFLCYSAVHAINFAGETNTQDHKYWGPSPH